MHWLGSAKWGKRIEQFGASIMNWLMLAVVGGAAVWFEYNYQRSRRPKESTALPTTSKSSVPETAPAVEAGKAPPMSSVSESDKKLNTTA